MAAVLRRVGAWLEDRIGISELVAKNLTQYGIPKRSTGVAFCLGGLALMLFGIQLVFSSQVELSSAARQRIGAELQAALFDLRRALQRPLARQSPETDTTLLEEVERLRREHPDLHLVLRPGSESVQIPPAIEPLAQSVLAEAVRNAHKHGTGAVTVTVGGDGTHAFVAVEDEGPGPSDPTTIFERFRRGADARGEGSGLGLAIVKAIAERHGGHVEVRGSRFTLVVKELSRTARRTAS